MKSFQLLFYCFVSGCFIACNNQPTTLFKKLSSSSTGIDFKNTIVESDSINPMNVVNIYNGGGVGVGDFNNDGKPDLYFTGNMVPSKLYLNKGNFEFDDITDKAGVEGLGRWARGVSVVDINNDGLMDIYICNTIYTDSLRRRNILYVNQGNDAAGIPHFKDMAAEYGLDIHVQSTMASFFDYDNDGDLDMYLTVNEASNGANASVFRIRNSNTAPSVGRLYRNDIDTILHRRVFHDVSKQAGMVLAGFGHAATICDINNDGWKDIYVSDDFISSNILYINNHDGTFTDRSREYFKHTSFNSMGQDVIDINNDGLADVVELDMNPNDNLRKKMMLSSNNYNVIQNFLQFSYQFQYVRNTFQLNQGDRLFENDSVGAPVFSEIGFMSGIAQTDWSWTPVITDFDNDGYRDMIVTNGFPKDVSDHDFIAYRSKAQNIQAPLSMISKIPVIKIDNFAFKNKDGISFTDVSKDWGVKTPSFSSGAVYADLDNDGDMDMIVSNINDEPFVYENTSHPKTDSTAHFLQVAFKGDKENINGLGAFADIYYDGNKHQVYEHNPYRGYLSSNQNIAHFGLGKIAQIDSLVIRWPNGTKQLIAQVKPDQLVTVNIADAKASYKEGLQKPAPLFKEITMTAGANFLHNDFDFIDFNIQTILPHKFSEYCPALAVADVDGNGIDDMVIGGTNLHPATVFMQQADGKFIQRELIKSTTTIGDQEYKDEGILLFDANGDGKTDVYIASGGYKFADTSEHYQDRLYINDGKGNFSLDKDALPINHTSKLCVRAFDFNKDGKLDLFVSGRVDPAKYPQPVSSFIFRNDTENGKTKFTDVTATVAPDLLNIGMVCDALFTDFDNDGQTDLMLAGEWMPVTFLKNTGGKFKNITASTGLSDKTGWWNSIVAGDFRHTGRMDYIVGNTGLNTIYQPSDQYPVFMTAKDFDHNGSYVPVTSLFLPATDGSLKEFPAFGRDDIAERMPTLKKRYDNYSKFANATMQDIFTPEMMKGAQRLKATMLQSCYLRNDGNGKFTIIPLPQQAQVSAINGMVTDDFDGDGNLDVLLNGNDFGTEVSIGRLDALNGLLLKGDGKGNFTPLSIMQSGIYIPGDGKALVKLSGNNGSYMIAASQNRGPLKLYKLPGQKKMIKANQDDVAVTLQYKNGTVQKEEFYYGDGFLSQSARFFCADAQLEKATITNSKGIARSVLLKQ
ncbi:MAG: VCBS repeat-containing protein [Chitinophagaceae bacterium]